MADRPLPRPPFDAALLADLHGDNVPAEVAADLWPAVRQDPDAVRYLAELDAVNDSLRALGTETEVLHRMPNAVRDRLDTLLDQLSADAGPDVAPGTDPDRLAGSVGVARGPASVAGPRLLTAGTADASALTDSAPTAGEAAAAGAITEPVRLAAQAPATDQCAGEAAGSSGDQAPVAELDQYRARRRRLLAAAAAAVPLMTFGIIAVVAGHHDSDSPSALRPSSTTLSEGDLAPAALLGAMGRNDVTGRLAAPGALNACVRAAGADRQVLGSTDTTFQGQPAALILVAGPHPPTVTALIVGTGCAPGDPQLRVHRDIG
ncbi:hypothetical protein [Nocardia stercoris]|uniref:Anti-sigma-M factor RsmA n=1 Tax=Nocardia stercoris TaxID=2483361 RepID=A0A3M2LAN2_9NOCA|nr:hypothetical protein [Nocardia stercoris]RMI34086.1 hypothetical protein EBN03_06530 [Nocardia stercoris]